MVFVQFSWGVGIFRSGWFQREVLDKVLDASPVESVCARSSTHLTCASLEVHQPFDDLPLRMVD
jgi:hypothetical protein